MKKTFITLLALAGVAGAASVDCTNYAQLGLNENLVGAYNFTTSSTTLGNLGVSGFTVSDGVAVLDGTTKPSGTNLGIGSATDKSWTLTFDLVTLANNNDWDNVLVLYSADGGDSSVGNQGYKYSMTLGLDNQNEFRVSSSNGGEATFNGGAAVTLYSGVYDSDKSGENVNYASGQTITLVQNGTAKTLTLYVNGEQKSQVTDWQAASIWGVRFGSGFDTGWGDRDPLNAGSIDNVAFWSTALSSAQVKSLIVPEPATATLSLLALAGLCARRRRA